MSLLPTWTKQNVLSVEVSQILWVGDVVPLAVDLLLVSLVFLTCSQTPRFVKEEPRKAVLSQGIL